MEHKYIGRAIPRVDAVKKVTGALEYAMDYKCPGALHAKLFRSQCARGIIKNLDITAALAVKGVEHVFSFQNLKQTIPRFGSVKNDQPVLADGEVRYYGEPIAAVLAKTEEIAEFAVSLIHAEYEVLPPACTIADALRDDAPAVNIDNAGSYGNPNIYDEWNYGWGDINDEIIGKAALTVENTYEFPMVNHFPLESFNCVAYQEENTVVIKSPVQHPFTLRRVISSSLKLDISRVRVIASSIGGGFGGKGYPKLEPLAAFLTLITGKPVQIRLSMKEGFFCSRRLSASVHIKTGFLEDGTAVFQELSADYLIGAYVDAAPRVVAKAAYLGCGPYRIPNIKINAKAVMSNTTPATAFRGFGMPQIMWGIESQMNEAARRLNINPLDIRLKNLPHKGEVLVPGDIPVDGDWHSGLKKAAELIKWNDVIKKNHGRGVAIGIKCPIPGTVSHATVRLHSDGSVTCAVGTTEMGQGARTVMTQIVSEILSVNPERVSVIMGDTAAVGFDIGTVASRSTVSMGNAVANGCEDIIKQLREMAGIYYNEKNLSLIQIKDGCIIFNGDNTPYSDFIQKCVYLNQGEIIGSGVFGGKRDESHPLGGLADFWEIIFTGCETFVDRDTGKITIEKLANVTDVGQVINPIMAKGQEEGAGLMGLGHTLMEQMLYGEDGKLLNAGPLDYRIPTAKDIPTEMLSSFVENKDGPGYFGSKGLGESGVIAVAPAVAGALYEACGVKIKELPLTSEKVWRELNNKRRS